MSFNGARHQMELRAEVARDRLLDTIDALDRKRHEVLDWRLQLRQHLTQLALVSVAVVGGLAMAIGTGLYRARLLADHRRRERVRALSRFWRHPERVALDRHHSLRTIAMSGLLTLLTLAAARIARRRG
jgi:hypothetical protein